MLYNIEVNNFLHRQAMEKRHTRLIVTHKIRMVKGSKCISKFYKKVIRGNCKGD